MSRVVQGEILMSEQTPEAKKALSKAVRTLRARLLEDLSGAMASAYLLQVKVAAQAKLDEAARVQRARLEQWLQEELRTLPKAEHAAARERLLAQVVTDAAFTLLLRLITLRLLEASGLRREKVVTGGWESTAYKDFRQLAPELVQGDPTEGYATLLGLLFSELSLELPGLFGDVRLTALVPIPPATLRAVVQALNAPELESCWRDDTTLGWVYQYWNDPEREALDKKLNEQKKLQNHEIASKTQMFTERYMVEWLLHNSLGTQWLAICRKHGWTAEVERKGADGQSLLERLDARRAAWRAKREQGSEPLDALMPIEGGQEAAWKYWVPQPIVPDMVDKAPSSLRAYKLLDPACGSGHFLVIAVGLLFELYREEARQRGEAHQPEWQPKAIVESILSHNLYGLDIDPRAVQLAAAALWLKAKQLCPEAEPSALNLVAPNLSLASLPHDDPALRELCASVERETGIPSALTLKVVHALHGADHLGTLLKVDAELEAALDGFEREAGGTALGRRKPQQGNLLAEQAFGPDQLLLVTREQAKATLLNRLEDFLSQHGGADDLGLRLRGEQLAAGVRFVRMVQEGQYDLVVGNPPYQGTSKMADAKYVQKHYPRGKADLYAAFLERGLQLAKEGGVSALLTMRNWMFIKQYAELREWLLESFDLRLLGDVDRGAFDEVPNEVLAAVMSLFRRARPGDASLALQPTPLDDKSYDRERTKRKRAAVLCQVGRFEFEVERLKVVPERPVVYWWDANFLAQYCCAPKVGDVGPVRLGLSTSDNPRFLRCIWELVKGKSRRLGTNCWEYDITGWRPLISGAAGVAWIAPLDLAVQWRTCGIELELFPAAVLRNPEQQMLGGVAFTPMGNTFAARQHRFLSMFDAVGRSVISGDRAQALANMNSSLGRRIMADLNPSITFTAGDVERMPLLPLAGASSVVETLDTAFTLHESHREPSVEFTQPGPSPWRYAQDWAQRAVDRPEGDPLPPYEPEFDPEPPSDYLSFALGVALGRFGARGEGILDPRIADLSHALPHGTLYLSALHEEDGLAHLAAAPLLAAWQTHGTAIQRGEKAEKTLREYLSQKFFAEVHRGMYENRPIHFPLSSEKKSFVAWVNIHRWHAGTLRALLADHLYPDKQRLEGEIVDLREAKRSADKKQAREAERRFAQVNAWLDELSAFIAAVEQCAEKGPPPTDAKCPARETDRRFVMDLDDGVMINAAALWPLLDPQWKDPKKWWKQLALAEGKKDYDWAHLSARYFPTRVYDKCKKDPSLGVAHGCFWKLHPENAYKWELRLQDEIGPEFKLDEPARTEDEAFTAAWIQASSDHYRAAFEAEHPEKVEALVAAEHKRREKKRRKAGEGEDEAQGELGLEGDEEENAEEALEQGAPLKNK